MIVPDTTDNDTLDSAVAYARAGFIVVPTDSADPKNPGSIMGKGWEHVLETDPENVADWYRTNDNRGIALHLVNAVAIDVDHADELQDDERAFLESSNAPVQRTPSGGRHHLFALPEGQWSGGNREWGEARTGNQVIAAAPSSAPSKVDGIVRPYVWERTGELPVLPLEWAARWLRAATNDASSTGALPDAAAWLSALPVGLPCGQMRAALEKLNKAVRRESGSAHEATNRALLHVLRFAHEGHAGAKDAVMDARATFVSTVSDRASDKEARGEFDRMVLGAVARINANPSTDTEHDCDDWYVLIRGIDQPRYEPPDFWDIREYLSHIKQAADAGLAAPYAVLLQCIGRVLSMVPSEVVLPAIVGGQVGSLNMLMGTVGESGEGKGLARGVAKALLPNVDTRVRPAGSGEGITRHFVSRVSMGKKQSTLVQHGTNVIVSVSEIDAVSSLMQRSGSTLSSVLRMAYDGSELGFSNANEERILTVKEQSYRLIFDVDVQPARSKMLLDSEDGGLLQRFVLVSAYSQPSDTDVDDPGPLKWELPTEIANPQGRILIPVPENIRKYIRDNRRAVLRRDTNAVKGHSLQTQLIVAFGFAVLDQRWYIDGQDWELADHMMRLSNVELDKLRKHMSKDAQAKNKTKAELEAAREDVKAKIAAQRIRADLLDMAKRGNGFTRHDVHDHWNDSGTAFRELDELVEQGMIVARKSGRGHRYVLKEGT